MMKFRIAGYNYRKSNVFTRNKVLTPMDGYPVYQPEFISEDLIFGRDD